MSNALQVDPSNTPPVAPTATAIKPVAPSASANGDHSPADIETVNCPICDSSSARSLQSFPPFGVVTCNSCTVTYLSPRLKEPAMMKIYAADTYFEGGESYGSYETQEKSLVATFRRMFTELKQRGLCKGSLLDIGCGYGYLLAEAGNLFSAKYGLEFSERAAAASRKYAAEVYTEPVEKLPQERKFSLITAIQVIEHVYNPNAFTKQLVDRLEKDGQLLLATPDIGSFWYPLFGKRWPSFKIPEHVLYFNKKTLTDLMKANGLVDVQEIPYPHAFPFTVVAKKFGITLPKFFDSFNFWLPKTTIALIGRKA